MNTGGRGQVGGDWWRWAGSRWIDRWSHGEVGGGGGRVRVGFTGGSGRGQVGGDWRRWAGLWCRWMRQAGGGRGQSYAVRSVAGVPLLALLTGWRAVVEVNGWSSSSSVGGPLEGVAVVVGEGRGLALLLGRGRTKSWSQLSGGQRSGDGRVRGTSSSHHPLCLHTTSHTASAKTKPKVKGECTDLVLLQTGQWLRTGDPCWRPERRH